MTNVQTEHQTVLELSDVKVNVKLDEGAFTTARLEKGGI